MAMMTIIALIEGLQFAGTSRSMQGPEQMDQDVGVFYDELDRRVLCNWWLQILSIHCVYQKTYPK